MASERIAFSIKEKKKKKIVYNTSPIKLTPRTPRTPRGKQSLRPPSVSSPSSPTPVRPEGTPGTSSAQQKTRTTTPNAARPSTTGTRSVVVPKPSVPRRTTATESSSTSSSSSSSSSSSNRTELLPSGSAVKYQDSKRGKQPIGFLERLEMQDVIMLAGTGKSAADPHGERIVQAAANASPKPVDVDTFHHDATHPKRPVRPLSSTAPGRGMVTHNDKIASGPLTSASKNRTSPVRLAFGRSIAPASPSTRPMTPGTPTTRTAALTRTSPRSTPLTRSRSLPIGPPPSIPAPPSTLFTLNAPSIPLPSQAIPSSTSTSASIPPQSSSSVVSSSSSITAPSPSASPTISSGLPSSPPLYMRPMRSSSFLMPVPRRQSLVISKDLSDAISTLQDAKATLTRRKDAVDVLTKHLNENKGPLLSKLRMLQRPLQAQLQREPEIVEAVCDFLQALVKTQNRDREQDAPIRSPSQMSPGTSPLSGSPLLPPYSPAYLEFITQAVSSMLTLPELAASFSPNATESDDTIKDTLMKIVDQTRTKEVLAAVTSQKALSQANKPTVLAACEVLLRIVRNWEELLVQSTTMLNILVAPMTTLLTSKHADIRETAKKILTRLSNASPATGQRINERLTPAGRRLLNLELSSSPPSSSPATSSDLGLRSEVLRARAMMRPVSAGHVRRRSGSSLGVTRPDGVPPPLGMTGSSFSSSSPAGLNATASQVLASVLANGIGAETAVSSPMLDRAADSASDPSASLQQQDEAPYMFGKKNRDPVIGSIVEVCGVPFIVEKVMHRAQDESSVIYRVYSQVDDVRYAYKIIQRPDTVVGGLTELGRMQRMQGSSHVIKLVFSEIEEDSTEHMVMELGETNLEDLISDHWHTWSINVKRSYIEQILVAVNDVHLAGFVHGDLSPRNFVLVQGTVKLIDFGISRELPMELVDGGVRVPQKVRVDQRDMKGSPDFMPPEFFRAAVTLSQSPYDSWRYGQELDVWSVGCILTFIACGKTPYNLLGLGDNNVSQLESFPPLPELDQADICPPHLHGLIKHALVFSPEERVTIPKLMDNLFMKPDTLLLSVAAPEVAATPSLMSASAFVNTIASMPINTGADLSAPATPHLASSAAAASSDNALVTPVSSSSNLAEVLASSLAGSQVFMPPRSPIPTAVTALPLSQLSPVKGNSANGSNNGNNNNNVDYDEPPMTPSWFNGSEEGSDVDDGDSTSEPANVASWFAQPEPEPTFTSEDFNFMPQQTGAPDDDGDIYGSEGDGEYEEDAIEADQDGEHMFDDEVNSSISGDETAPSPSPSPIPTPAPAAIKYAVPPTWVDVDDSTPQFNNGHPAATKNGNGYGVAPDSHHLSVPYGALPEERSLSPSSLNRRKAKGSSPSMGMGGISSWFGSFTQDSSPQDEYDSEEDKYSK
eukprot:TRINITY_DN6819_c0_g1_i4.p1 TRINITY_DN6819_c0_g1~~TRINITY_DN6819_c0_g1_i4.p1  ORF type:complete len:1405 (-),score=448.83 TRINITY_DN6819_c0_g1_i4:20-4234(-)